MTNLSKSASPSEPRCAHLNLMHDGNASNPAKCTDCGQEINITYLTGPPEAAEPRRDEREAFEKWALWEDQLESSRAQSQLYRYEHKFNEANGTYYNIYWQIAWEAWQAARASAAPTQPMPPNETNDELYLRMQKEITASSENLDLATVNRIHDYWEFESETEADFDAFLHGHIVKGKRLASSPAPVLTPDAKIQSAIGCLTSGLQRLSAEDKDRWMRHAKNVLEGKARDEEIQQPSTPTLTQPRAFVERCPACGATTKWQDPYYQPHCKQEWHDEPERPVLPVKFSEFFDREIGDMSHWAACGKTWEAARASSPRNEVLQEVLNACEQFDRTPEVRKCMDKIRKLMGAAPAVAGRTQGDERNGN